MLEDDRPAASVDVLLILERLAIFRFEGRISLDQGRDADLLEPEGEEVLDEVLTGPTTHLLRLLVGQVAHHLRDHGRRER